MGNFGKDFAVKLSIAGVFVGVTLFIVYIAVPKRISGNDNKYQALPGYVCKGKNPFISRNETELFCYDSCIQNECECFDYEVKSSGSSICRVFTQVFDVQSTKSAISAFRRLYSSLSPIDASIQVHDEILAKTSDTFKMTGVNFDFWPSSKSKWDKSGALVIDLNNTRLRTLAKALSGSLLRMGGSPVDMLLYDTYPGACSEYNLNKTQKHGPGYYCPIWDQVKGQCLTMRRWKELNQFAAEAGLKIAFDLNACWGRHSAKDEMDFTMIEGLIRETASGKDSWAQVFAFEFGNELYSNVAAGRYASDMKQIQNLLKKYWKGKEIPKLVGPDCGAGYLSNHYLDAMLTSAEGNNTLHAVTVHLYGENGICKRHLTAPGYVLNVTCMDSLLNSHINDYKKTTKKHGVPLWIGEGALHGSSGVAGLTNVFTSSFWYINTLANFAEANLGLFSRQTLMGGDYELIDKKTFTPNPDYWLLLLWRQVSGDSALKSDWLECNEMCSKCLRSYSRSSLKRRKLTIVINFCLEQSFSVQVVRETENLNTNANYVNLYQLTGSPSSRVIKLNGEDLVYVGGDTVPELKPYINPASCKVEIPVSSITFIDF